MLIDTQRAAGSCWGAMDAKNVLSAAAVSLCLPAPAATAQIFPWDPRKNVQEALPEGVPNEAKFIQARQRVREMSQDAMASLYDVAPGTRRTIERSAGYAVFSTFGGKLLFAGGTTGKGMVVNLSTARQTFMKALQVQGVWVSA